MHSHHSPATRQALYRVFVRPNKLHQPSASPARLPITSKCLPWHHQQQQCRLYAKYRPPVQRSQAYDEEIQAQVIHIVDQDGKLGPSVPRNEALRSFNRNTHNLVQVSVPETDPSTGRLKSPVCKIISKEKLRAAERAKAKPKKSPDQLAKQLEINWAIDKHDFQHRLKRFVEFLEQGRRVDVLLARKKSGRQATPEEAEDLVATLREKCTEVGGKEWKAMMGTMGMMANLHFEGPKGKS